MLKLAVGRAMVHHDVELSSIAEHARDSSPDSEARSKRVARLKPKRVMFDEAPTSSYEHNIAAIIRLQRFIRVGAQYDPQTSMLFRLTSLVFLETNILSNPFTHLSPLNKTIRHAPLARMMYPCNAQHRPASVCSGTSDCMCMPR
jgi:hypothetical protein